jgi:hypothetical protein
MILHHKRKVSFFIIIILFLVEIDINQWRQEKQKLVNLGNKDHFSNEVVFVQKDKALNAEKKLFKLRKQMLEEDDCIVTGSYYDKLQKLLKSPLYDCLNVMPKPVIHHIHLTAACPVDFLVEKICYFDFVYFNQKE